MTLERNHALFFCNRWWFHASYGCLQFQNCAICETASGLFFYGNNFLDSILAIDLFWESNDYFPICCSNQRQLTTFSTKSSGK